MKNVNKINVLKIFIKNLVENKRLIRLIVLLIASILLSQALGITIAADEDEVPDPTGLP